MPAGRQTSSSTRSWKGVPAARSARRARSTNPPLQYEKAVPGSNFVG